MGFLKAVILMSHLAVSPGDLLNLPRLYLNICWWFLVRMASNFEADFDKDQNSGYSGHCSQ